MSLMMKAAWGENMGVPGVSGRVPGQAHRGEAPAVGQAGVSLSQLQEADFGVAHHQAQAVVLRVKFRVVDQVEAGQSVVIGLRPNQVEQMNGGEVKGISQGLPEGNGAVS